MTEAQMAVGRILARASIEALSEGDTDRRAAIEGAGRIVGWLKDETILSRLAEMSAESIVMVTEGFRISPQGKAAMDSLRS